jgi:putative flippase GtrA
MKTKLAKASKYASVAGGAAIIDWIMFVALHFLGVPPLGAQATSRISGGVFSFLANRYWSFDARKKTHVTVQGRRFLLLYIVSYSMSLGLFYLFVDILALPIFPAKLGVDVIGFVFNFLIMQAYVFHERHGFTHRIKMLFTRQP